MRTGLARVLCLLSLASVLSASARAQQESETRNEVWPELDVIVPLNDKFRLFFLATVSRSRETKKNFEGQVGAHVDYALDKRVSFRVGYRYGFSLASSDDPFKEHRVILEQTLRHPLPLEVLLSDRNREDLRWVNGGFSARYRNRVTLERTFKVLKHSITPYGSGEIFYDSRFNTFNRNRLAAGVQYTLRDREPWFIPFRRQRVIDIYYMRQNDSRSSPEHVNAIGISFSVYF